MWWLFVVSIVEQELFPRTPFPGGFQVSLATREICTTFWRRKWPSICVPAQKVGVGSDTVAVRTPHQWSVGFRKQARPLAAPPPAGSSSASLKFWVRCVGSGEGCCLVLQDTHSIEIGDGECEIQFVLACLHFTPIFPSWLLVFWFLSQLSMQRQQFCMKCLISSHNYCSYPCDNSLFLPLLVILLLWSALTDSEMLLESR